MVPKLLRSADYKEKRRNEKNQIKITQNFIKVDEKNEKKKNHEMQIFENVRGQLRTITTRK